MHLTIAPEKLTQWDTCPQLSLDLCTKCKTLQNLRRNCLTESYLERDGVDFDQHIIGFELGNRSFLESQILVRSKLQMILDQARNSLYYPPTSARMYWRLVVGMVIVDGSGEQGKWMNLVYIPLKPSRQSATYVMYVYWRAFQNWWESKTQCFHSGDISVSSGFWWPHLPNWQMNIIKS